MFGSNILEVSIGLILIYLLMSLVVSGVREGIETLVKARAVHLERGIKALLREERLVENFYKHPLISSLYKGEYTWAANRRLGRAMPTYIPSANFANALIDIALRGDVLPAPEKMSGGSEPGPAIADQDRPRRVHLSMHSLRSAVEKLDNQHVRRAMLSAMDTAKDDLEQVQTNLQAWFDSAMDRVSGWYKRRTQVWLFFIAAVVTGVMNVNTIAIAEYLATDDEARAALVNRAQAIAQDTTYRRLVDTADTSAITAAAARAAYADLQLLSLPIGWDRQLPAPRRAGVEFWLKQFGGLFITVFAITLGAPFWFDMLNKVMVIRSTVKPDEKSPEEGSEDRKDNKKS